MSVQKDPEHREIEYLRRLADLPGKRILEIGIGEGRLTWELAAPAARIVGVDIDRDSLRVAHIDRPADLETRAQLLQASGAALPFHRDAFDLAVFSWSF